MQFEIFVEATIRSFRELDVWNRSMDLVDLVFEAGRSMPPNQFDLRRQMQRAAVSIPANIAEGYRRKGRRPAYQNHISIAMGSQGELETELEVTFRNGFLDRQACAGLIEMCGRVGAMLNRLHDALGPQ